MKSAVRDTLKLLSEAPPPPNAAAALGRLRNLLHVALRGEALAAARDLVDRAVQLRREEELVLVNKYARALWAEELMGLPDPTDPRYEAEVVHTAYRLGELQRRKS